MSDIIEKKIKEGFQNADTGLKKAGLVAGAVLTAPAIVAGVTGEKAYNAGVMISKKAKKASIAAQIKKYNPLFPEKYESEDFNVPNMLMLVDDAQRKDIEVCKGSIGWLSTQSGVEVMHLYDNALDGSGLEFFPAASCDSVYYVDPHKKNLYLNVDSLFETFQQQKLAELARVAYCLGARSYSIEIIEEEKIEKKTKARSKTSANVKIVNAEATAEYDSNNTSRTKRRYFTHEEYEDKRKPVAPVLSWFKNDDNITGLIEQVCNGTGTIKSKVLYFEGSQYAGMSRSTAAKVNAAIKKIGADINADLEEKAEREYSSKMIFRLEF